MELQSENDPKASQSKTKKILNLSKSVFANNLNNFCNSFLPPQSLMSMSKFFAKIVFALSKNL